MFKLYLCITRAGGRGMGGSTDFKTNIEAKKKKIEEESSAVGEQLTKVPGLAESLSTDLIKQAYDTILIDSNLAKIEALQPGDTLVIDKPTGAAYDPRVDRTINVFKDEGGNIKIFLNIKSKRMDGTKYNVYTRKNYQREDELAENQAAYFKGKDNECKVAVDITDDPKIRVQLIGKKRYTEEEMRQYKKEHQGIANDLNAIPGLAHTVDTFVPVKNEQGKNGEPLFKLVRYAEHYPHELSEIIHPVTDDENSIKIGDQSVSINTLRQMKDILEQVAAMDAQNLVHRDLKPENILIDKDGKVRIADLDTVALESKDKDDFSKFVGTPEYLSPEAMVDFLERIRYESSLFDIVSTAMSNAYGGQTEAVQAKITEIKNQTIENEGVDGVHVRKSDDTYAIGLLFYELITGNRLPSSKGPEAPKAMKVVKDFIQNNEILRNMTHPDPTLRWTAAQALEAVNKLLPIEEKKANSEEQPVPIETPTIATETSIRDLFTGMSYPGSDTKVNSTEDLKKYVDGLKTSLLIDSQPPQNPDQTIEKLIEELTAPTVNPGEKIDTATWLKTKVLLLDKAVDFYIEKMNSINKLKSVTQQPNTHPSLAELQKLKDKIVSLDGAIRGAMKHEFEKTYTTGKFKS